jgi:hypothetical protein
MPCNDWLHRRCNKRRTILGLAFAPLLAGSAHAAEEGEAAKPPAPDDRFRYSPAQIFTKMQKLARPIATAINSTIELTTAALPHAASREPSRFRIWPGEMVWSRPEDDGTSPPPVTDWQAGFGTALLL